MANYFDYASADDKKLLLSSHRTHPDLETVAALAEADVIEHYTERPPEILYTARLGARVDGLITGATGRFEDVTTTGQPSSATVAQRRVYLLGYKTDSGHADVDPALKTALKRAIAEVINWRLSRLTREPAVDSASDGGGKSRSFSPNSQDAFPPEWSRRLEPFDSREGLVGL